MQNGLQQLKNQSSKRSKLDREVAPLRRAYLDLHPECMICQQSQSVLVHEISGGSGRRALSIGEPATWLALGGGMPPGCHEQIHHSLKEWSRARQMAYKLVRDPDNFDLDKVNQILSGGRGRPVDWVDIAQHLDAL